MEAGGYVHIATFGCQMNERDSDLIQALCAKASYAVTPDPAVADLIVVNTCSIRKKAEEKVYSLLGRLRRIKKDKPELVIVVAGCVAQQAGKGLLKRMPHVDIVVGPQGIYRLPQLLDKVKQQKGPCVATELSASFEIPPYMPADWTETTVSSHKAFVTIMQGCNNFCTYCVVPYTRGREISRPVADIVFEVTELCNKGTKEITLLGQNVNSFGHAGQSQFPQLLQAVADVPGLERIRFTTSHPKDLSEELMRQFRDNTKLCPHIHLPVQSGSNRVLRKMNRKYTRETFLKKIDALRTLCPEIAITTDIIVGFPGEDDADFEQSMELIETVRFHGFFSFKYSDRAPAKAATLSGKVPEQVKSRRLSLLQSKQEQITIERNHEFVGRVLKIMVDGPSKAVPDQFSGRSATNHIVNFLGNAMEPGSMADVRIDEACSHSLRGSLVDV